MLNYQGEKCPVCNEKFEKNDDIVVCPSCGTPYHRSCYKKIGKCLFTDKHPDGYYWKPSDKSNSGASNNQEKQDNSENSCPRCGHRNPSDSIFCNKCGMPLISDKNNPFSNIDSTQQTQTRIPFIFDPLGGIPENEKIKGIKASDFSKFIQQNTAYYLNVFKRLKDLNMSRFSFCGFLFHGGWLLYRKQYKLGAILTSLSALSSILLTYISYNYSQPLLEQMFNAANVDIATANFSTMANVLSQQMPTLSATQSLIMFLPSILYLIQLAIMIFVGVMGNRLYFKHCIKKINAAKKTTTTENEYYNKLNQTGGVNTPLAICLLICYIIINSLPNFLI